MDPSALPKPLKHRKSTKEILLKMFAFPAKHDITSILQFPHLLFESWLKCSQKLKGEVRWQCFFSLYRSLFSSSDLSSNGWLGRYLHPSCPSLLHPFILCFLPPLGEDISFLIEAGQSTERLRWRLALFALRLPFGWLSKRQEGLPNRTGSTPLKRAQQSDYCVCGTGEVTYYKQKSERSFLHRSEGRLKPKSLSWAFCFTPSPRTKAQLERNIQLIKQQVYFGPRVQAQKISKRIQEIQISSFAKVHSMKHFR